MWHNFLPVLIFLLKAIIIILAILVIFAGILAIASKNKFKSGKIKIINLNTHYEDLRKTLREEILDKKARKILIKVEKAENKKLKASHEKPHLFILRFKGDIRAHAVEALREEITAILMIAKPEDEVLLCLESPGGVVNGYGLAASQLQRIKQHGIKLTVAVDAVAASGGYMMACVANHIIASPFAIIGSIGVIAQMPNFNRLLKKHDIDFEQISAGQYKRTLSVFGENTSEGRKKFQEEIELIHDLFKAFVHEHRPKADIDKISTGEYWLAAHALERQLVDALGTSDDYILSQSENKKIYEIQYKTKEKLFDKLIGSVQGYWRTGL